MAAPTNGQVVMALSAGHVAWALVAHREALTEVLAEGVVGTVGDGVFVQEHARDERAAAFWFLLIGPLLGMTGMLAHDAERRGDHAAVRRASRVGLALCVVGAAVVPRSGFPAGLAVMLHGTRVGGRPRS